MPKPSIRIQYVCSDNTAFDTEQEALDYEEALPIRNDIGRVAHGLDRDSLFDYIFKHYHLIPRTTETQIRTQHLQD